MSVRLSCFRISGLGMTVSLRALTIAGAGTGCTAPPVTAGQSGRCASTCLSVVYRRKFGIIRFLRGIILPPACLPGITPAPRVHCWLFGPEGRYPMCRAVSLSFPCGYRIGTPFPDRMNRAGLLRTDGNMQVTRVSFTLWPPVFRVPGDTVSRQTCRPLWYRVAATVIFRAPMTRTSFAPAA